MLTIIQEHISAGVYAFQAKESDFIFHDIEGVALAVSSFDYSLNNKTRKVERSAKLGPNGKRIYAKLPNGEWLPCGFDHGLCSLIDRMTTPCALNNDRLIDRVKAGLGNSAGIEAITNHPSRFTA